MHYRCKVESQINEMLNQGIIEESNSPWMAPAVFAKKKSKEIRICVDYRELNKKSIKMHMNVVLCLSGQTWICAEEVFVFGDNLVQRLVFTFRIIINHISTKVGDAALINHIN